MVHLRRLGLALTMTVLISVTLFLSCVKADIQLSQEFVEPVENWSFEEIEEGAGSPCDIVDWSTNNGGWREPRSDVNQDGYVSATDIVKVILIISGVIPKPYWPLVPDVNCDGKVSAADIVKIQIDISGERFWPSPIDGWYSWYTSGGGDYKMWQWLDFDAVMAVAGEKVKFSFYFYPESVASDGSQNNARAEIYYIYNYGQNDGQVNGFWIAPTELKWYNAYVTVTLPATTSYIAVIIHGKPDFKAWIDVAELTTPDYNLYYAYPPYDNQGAYPESGTCKVWDDAKVCAYADKSTGQASLYSLDWSGIGTGREAYAQFNRNPEPGNSPQLYEGGDLSVGVYWVAYGHLGQGGPGIPCASHVTIEVYLYWFNPLEGWWWPVKTYTWTISSFDYPNQDIYYSGSVSWWISSPPKGSGYYTVAAGVRTWAYGEIDCWAEANFFPFQDHPPYSTWIDYIKMSD